METTAISRVGQKAGATATVRGWLYNKRSSGKIQFLIVRDGTGYLQCVVPRADVPPEVWDAAESAAQECSLRVSGTVREDKRAPGGYEMTATAVEILGESKDYPISPKEHGVDFLMNLRHLWMRSSQQHAVLRVRSEMEQAIADFFYEREFVRIDSPILTRIVGRGHVHALRDGLLRRQGVPVAVRTALPRAGGGLLRQGLLLRPDLPRGEVEDAAPPDRVLDGRARGRVPRLRGTLRARRGLHRVPRRAGPRALRRAAEAPRARPEEARDHHEALPADHLPRRRSRRSRARDSR